MDLTFGNINITRLLDIVGKAILPLGILALVAMLVLPLPTSLLDTFFVSNILVSLLILMVALHTYRPLDFSSFPNLLLIATIFRLALNVASTRIVLTEGHTGSGAAGQVIEAFGKFVIAGNYTVGIFVFVILVIINLIVITKGAGRVAEVSARFTLDAMPGKQMAIDADLNAGLIDEEQAKNRRKEVAEEADFYGSMDGASKFVRGDAIAGILITVINVIGGIVVGMVQGGLDFSGAAETFTLLTVGDGLVTQIPALIISTAAGVIATRNNTEFSLGQQVGNQLKIHPKAIYFSATVLFIFAVIPGLPKLPFIAVGSFLMFVAYRIEKGTERKELEDKERQSTEKEQAPDNLEELLPLELIELEIGYGLVNFVDSEQNGDLLERITHIRKQFALDWGVIIPSVRIKDNLELKPGGYSLKIKGIEVAKGELLSDHFLAMDPGTVIEKIEGVETIEPVFGLPAVWITEDQRDEAQYNGYTVVDLSTVKISKYLLTRLIVSSSANIF